MLLQGTHAQSFSPAANNEAQEETLPEDNILAVDLVDEHARLAEVLRSGLSAREAESVAGTSCSKPSLQSKTAKKKS